MMTNGIGGITDEQLLAEIQQGHQRALSDLYDRFANRIYGMALHKLEDPSEAQNATQDVFVNIWQISRTFRPREGTAANWLLTVAHNRINDRFRQHRQSGAIKGDISHDPSVAAADSGDTENRGTANSAQKALQGLSDEEREVVVLSYYQGNSESEISQKLGVPLATIKNRMRSALASLRNA